MYKNEKNEVFKRIIDIYSKEQVTLEIAKLRNTIQEYPNFTKQLAALKKGKYLDKKGEEKDLGYNYPQNDFQKWALEAYIQGVKPIDMLTKMTDIMKELKADVVSDVFNKRKDIRKEIIKAAADNYGEDKDFEKFVNKCAVNDILDVLKHYNAIMKRREELKHLTKEDLEAGRGGLKLSEETLRSLKPYLNEQDADGNYKHQYEENGVTYYDLSEISDIIGDHAGYDFFINQNDVNQDYCEIENTRFELANVLDAGAFDQKYERSQTKDLIKFCGYEIDGRDRSNWAGKLLAGIIVGGAAGGLGHVISSRDIKVNVTDENIVNVNIQGMGNINVAEVLTSSVLVKTGGLVSSIATGAGIGAVPAIIDIIRGEDRNEGVCHNYVEKFNPNCRTANHLNLDEFEQYLINGEGQGSEAKIKAMLKPYRLDANGNWDYVKWMTDVNKQRGVGSQLNGIECLNPLGMGEEVANAPVEFEMTSWEETVENQGEDTVISENMDKFTGKEVAGANWECLIRNGYGDDFIEKYGLAKAIRILKLAQCVTDGNYSEKRMEDLYAKSKLQNCRYELTHTEGFNAELFFKDIKTGKVGILSASDLPSEEYTDGSGAIKRRYAVKLPAELAGNKRVAEHGYNLGGCGKLKLAEVTELDKPSSYFGEQTKSGEITYTKTGHWALRYNGKVETFDTEAELQERVKAIKDENPAIGEPKKVEKDVFYNEENK